VIKVEGVEKRQGLYGFEFRDVDLRRVDPEERKRYDIKQLWQRSHEIINLAAQGFKNTEIAEIVGVTPTCVSMTLNSELGQKKLSDIRLGRDNEAIKTTEKIRILTAKALQVYHEIFDNEDGQATLKDRKDVADTIVLELSGLRAPTKIQSVSTVLTAEELKEFKERGLRAAGGNGSVIEITPQPNTECSQTSNTISKDNTNNGG